MGSLGLVIESLVCVLLAVTIGYCILLNGRLKAMRTDDAAMRATIADLVSATDTAERAVAGLKRAVAEQESTLAARLLEAESVSRQLDSSVGDGEEILQRLTQITAAARSARRPAPEESGEAVPTAAETLDDEPDAARLPPRREGSASARLQADLRRLRRGAAA